jgi:hypothetical protein
MTDRPFIGGSDAAAVLGLDPYRTPVPATRNARNGISAEDVSHQIPGVWLEVKRRERLNVSEAMKQARYGATMDETPIVVHRRSRESWLATLPLADLLELMGGNK